VVGRCNVFFDTHVLELFDIIRGLQLLAVNEEWITGNKYLSTEEE
jgi:hypothetical protein